MPGSRAQKDEMLEDPNKEEEKAEETQLNPLLSQLSEEKQEELVQIVMEDYTNATNARKKEDWGTDKLGKGVDFETKYADLISLYEGADEVRPEAWMCGRSLKIAQAIVELLVARLLPAVWNENSIRWRPVEFTDKKRVERVNRIMKWTTMVWMKMQRDIHDFIRSAIMMGTVYTEPYWSVKKRDIDKTEQVPVQGEDGQQLTDPITGEGMTIETKLLHIDEKPALRFIPVTKVLTQPGQTDINKEAIIKLENFYYHELEAMQKQGIAQNVTDILKGQVDKIITDKFGEELEKAEKIADMNAKRRMHPVDVLVWYGEFDADDDGFAEEIIAMVSLKEEVFIRAIKTSKVSRTGKRPIKQTNFIHRIHKLLGIGVLEQVKPLAEEIDACFRQLQDANTLSIMRWGFYDPNSDYSPDEHVAKPRAMYPVTNPQQNVFFPEINIPIERLLNAIRLVLEFVERLTAASSFMLGKESEIAGGSGTATRTQVIASSAETRFNLPAMNLREGLAEILTEIFNLCHLNMPDGLEERILGEDGEKIFGNTEEITDAFSTEMDAFLLPNADFGDINTGRELAVLLYDKFVTGGNPLIVGDVNRIYHATANVFKAYGEDPREWLGQPGTKKETNDPEVEHTIMREGRIIHAEPQENHLEHIQVHMQYINGLGPDALLWPPGALDNLRKHIQQHEQLLQLVMQFQQGQKKGGGLDNQQAKPGEPTANGGLSSGAGGKPNISSDANPASASPQNQTAGTTQGTPAVG